MKILMMSWEYPPNQVGGLGRHVSHISTALAKRGVDVHVVTPGTTDETEEKGAQPVVHRVAPYNLSAPDFTSWVLQLNMAMMQRAVTATEDYGPFDIVHAHDWLSAFASRAYKHAYRLPLVATIHATEAGRNAGIHTRQQSYISDIEWWLAYEAWKVICCSEYMKREVQGVFGVPQDKVAVIPNGVKPEEFAKIDGTASRREDYASPDQAIIFFVGRLVREKGVHVLIEAVRKLIDQGRKIKLVIAGSGPYEEELKYIAASQGVFSHVYFTGRISDAVRNNLYAWADAAVFPSLYEPFGIVALEAMSAGSGLIVSDTGGLSEVVTHGVDGLKANPGDAGALAFSIAQMIDDKKLRDRIRTGGKDTVRRRFLWPDIADTTALLYDRVLDEYKSSPWARHNDNLGREINAGRYNGGRRRLETQAINMHSAEADGASLQQTGNGAHSGSRQ